MDEHAVTASSDECSRPKRKAPSDSVSSIRNISASKSKKFRHSKGDSSSSENSAENGKDGSSSQSGRSSRRISASSLTSVPLDPILFPPDRGIDYCVGSKVRVLEFGKWYNAKIVDIRTWEGQILIHFDNWSKRFDEWIAASSSRLTAIDCESVKGDNSIEPFEVGDFVFANAVGTYPAQIVECLECDKYKLLYYDGLEKVAHRRCLKKMTNEQVQKLDLVNFGRAKLLTTNANEQNKTTTSEKKDGWRKSLKEHLLNRKDDARILNVAPCGDDLESNGLKDGDSIRLPKTCETFQPVAEPLTTTRHLFHSLSCNTFDNNEEDQNDTVNNSHFTFVNHDLNGEAQPPTYNNNKNSNYHAEETHTSETTVVLKQILEIMQREEMAAEISREHFGRALDTVIDQQKKLITLLERRGAARSTELAYPQCNGPLEPQPLVSPSVVLNDPKWARNKYKDDVRMLIKQLTLELASRSLFGDDVLKRSNVVKNDHLTKRFRLDVEKMRQLKQMVRNKVSAISEADFELKWLSAERTLQDKIKNLRRKICRCASSATRSSP